MKICVRLVPMPMEAAYAPLGALGYCLMRSHFWTPSWLSARASANERSCAPFPVGSQSGIFA
jgi:hypothetical protein